MALTVSLEEAIARLPELAQRALAGEECTLLVDGEPLVSLVATPRLRGLLDLEEEIMSVVDAQPRVAMLVREAQAEYQGGNAISDDDAMTALQESRDGRDRMVG
jgi:antitoxin (DNA-binding transcriptional repressor) of toxin-antitoxin stability system